ncbi:MAG: xanthine dehydrogenase family protein molybdopterin-binding subunit, partial [Nitrososphaerales archaeon]
MTELLKKRVEDFRFLVGRARYVDDYNPDNVAYVAVLRSPYAHASIKNIDLEDARNSPDFLDAITGLDLVNAEGTGPLYEAPGQRPTQRYHLPIDKVRYVGEPVAAILVKRKYAVEDILEKVKVEYARLKVVSSIEESKANSSLIYDGWHDNVARRLSFVKGNYATARSSSKYVANARLGIKRQAGAAIEPRSVVASFDRDSDTYNVYSSVQSAHALRAALANELRKPEEAIRVRVDDVGGGFGTKTATSYPAVLICCILAKRNGLTTKWTSTRTEDLLETGQGRDQFCDIELAADSNAKIVGLRAHVEIDVGVSGGLINSIEHTLNLMPCVYKIPNFDLSGICYVTNKTPTGPVRGNGRPESCFFIERAVDILSDQIQMDPIEFRRRNLLEAKDLPYETGTGLIYDSGNFPLLLAKVIDASDYEALKGWRASVNHQESSEKIAGIGVSMEVEDTGSRFSETAKIVASEDGLLTIFTGSSPHGQGQETMLARLCSEELRIPMNEIRVVWGDTRSIPSGLGTFGSRSVVTGGSAVIEASRRLRSEIIERVANRENLSPEQIKFESGKIVSTNQVTGRSKEIMSLAEPVQQEGKIEAFYEFKLESFPVSSCAHLCAMLLDKETGKIEITKYVVVDDCGRVINEFIVDGQIHGGVAHGIGGAVYEQLVHDDEAQPLSTTFLDYTIPTALEVPEIEILHIETLSPLTPNGAKGVGESGTIAAYPAVFNALNDA